MIPADLRRWPLAADGAGRIGGVRLELADGPNGVRLAACYQQTPLRVLPPFSFPNSRLRTRGGAAQPGLLYLLNPTAGLMDGDGQLVELRAGPGARAVVVGQSATRIHPAVHGLCTQQWHVHVARGGLLVVLPGPAIPFRACRYYQRVEIDLEEGAGLLWGDVWLAGRYARGRDSELFQFTLMRQDFLVRRDGRPVFRDHFDWRGPWDEASAAWHFGRANACGSLFLTGPAAETALVSDESLDGACFTTGAGDTCCRWRGPSESVVAAVVRTALRLAPTLAAGPHGPSAAWLSGCDLAPCHWFSLVEAEHVRTRHIICYHKDPKNCQRRKLGTPSKPAPDEDDIVIRDGPPPAHGTLRAGSPPTHDDLFMPKSP